MSKNKKFGVLTKKEFSTSAKVAKKLSRCVGIENAISGRELCERYFGSTKEKRGAQMRKIIHFIRVNKVVPNLVATRRGYHVENDETKVRIYLATLNHRISQIIAVAESFNL